MSAKGRAKWVQAEGKMRSGGDRRIQGYLGFPRSALVSSGSVDSILVSLCFGVPGMDLG